MVEPGVNGAWIYKFRKPQLSDVPHPLQEWMLDQVKYLFTFDRDKPVYGIVYDFILVQGMSLMVIGTISCQEFVKRFRKCIRLWHCVL